MDALVSGRLTEEDDEAVNAEFDAIFGTLADPETALELPDVPAAEEDVELPSVPTHAIGESEPAAKSARRVEPVAELVAS